MTIQSNTPPTHGVSRKDWETAMQVIALADKEGLENLAAMIHGRLGKSPQKEIEPFTPGTSLEPLTSEGTSQSLESHR